MHMKTMRHLPSNWQIQMISEAKQGQSGLVSIWTRDNLGKPGVVGVKKKKKKKLALNETSEIQI